MAPFPGRPRATASTCIPCIPERWVCLANGSVASLAGSGRSRTAKERTRAARLVISGHAAVSRLIRRRVLSLVCLSTVAATR